MSLAEAGGAGNATAYANCPPLTHSMATAIKSEAVDDLVLAELSLMPGGADLWTLEGRPSLGSVGALGLLGALSRLVAGGLVEAAAQDSTARYRVVPSKLETIGEHTSARASEAATEHLSWCLSVAAEVVAGLEAGGLRPRRGIERGCAEQANLEAAFEAALSEGDFASAVRLARALCVLWEFRPAPPAAPRLLGELLGRSLGPTARIELLAGRARLSLGEGDLDGALRGLGEALILAGGGGDRRLRAQVSCELGLMLVLAGDIRASWARLSQAAFELKGLGAAFELGRASWAMGLAEIGACAERARSHLEDALFCQLGLGDGPGHGRSLLARAVSWLMEGDRDQALKDAAAASEAFVRVGDMDDLASALFVVAGALGQESLQLATQLAACARSVSTRRSVWDWLGWTTAGQRVLERADRLGSSGAVMSAGTKAAGAPTRLLRRLVEVAERGVVSNEVEIKVLGGFEVRRDGREVRLAPQVGLLLKRLVVSRDGLHVEEVIDFLWPEASAERGRRRLRNLLARLARSAGPVVVRRADVVRLAPGVLVDAARFEAAAHEAIEALRSGKDRREALRRARWAHDLYAGDLLPEDRYEDFLLIPRERLRRLRLRLLDAAATAALAEGSNGLAETCLRLALEADPADERRYVALAEVLVATGRFMPAAELCGRARLLAQQLGLQVSPAVVKLEAAISGRSKGGTREGQASSR
jgi:DNA-binding SARP family transcriptional activator